MNEFSGFNYFGTWKFIIPIYIKFTYTNYKFI
jgi:hypothetical protein